MACFQSELAAEPQIQSLQDLDAVFAEISLIDHHEAELAAECSREIDTVKAVYGAQMVCTVAESDVALADRRKQLYESAEAWCRSDLAQHLPKNEKSIELAHGTAGLREQTPAVQFLPDVTEKVFVGRVDKKTGIVAAVGKLLKKAIGVVPLEDVIRFRPEVNKVALKKLWDAQPRCRATLRKLGITVQAGDDQVVLKPTQYVVANPPE